MKSYQRALLSATLAAIASSDILAAAAKKKKEQEPVDKKPINRDWLCDANKKNVGKIKCATCKHSFTGMKRRKHCSVCHPGVVKRRLADEQIRYNDPMPDPHVRPAKVRDY